MEEEIKIIPAGAQAPPVCGEKGMSLCTRPVNLAMGQRVPCGRCESCKANRSAEWAMRLQNEMDIVKKGLFCTWTYDDDNIPMHGTLVKSHLQNYIKIIRNEIDKKIKYYCVGEYGDKSKRPHYHGIVFNVCLDDVDLFRSEWKKGFSCYGTVSLASIRYTTNYVMKKLYGKEKEYYKAKGILPEFAIMSKGLGYDWAKDNFDHIYINGGIRESGRVKRIPRYYVKKFSGMFDNDYFNDKIVENAHEFVSIDDELKRSEREEEKRRGVKRDQRFWNGVRKR